METQLKPFQPIRFLAAMATGGLASAPYLLNVAAGWQGFWTNVLMLVSVFFVMVHFSLTVAFLVQGWKWLTGQGLRTFREDWTRSPQILMPLGSIAMSINVFVGPVRGLLPSLDQWAYLWQPALVIIWVAIAITSLVWIADLLAVIYSQNIDITKLGFVWLFPSLTLGLMAVSGAFISSMANYAWVAHVTGIGSAIVALFGLFLIGILVPTVVRNQLRAPFLPALGGAYSMLNMVPTIALYGIAFVHWAIYAERWLAWSMRVPVGLVLLMAWAFATSYAIFGLRLLYKTVRDDLQRGQYVGNQWALSCVPIAWSVMTSLLQETLFHSHVWTFLAAGAILMTIPVFVLLLIRMARCVGWLSNVNGKVSCA